MALREEADGRRLRRENNRDAVLDALAALFAEGDYQPGANQIAERAGLSPRSLFRYFEDVDDLLRAAIDRQLEAARPLLEVTVAPEAPTDAKVAAVVDARARLFEAIAPAARAARISAHRHRVIARQLRSSRSYLRRQVQEVFGPELGRRPDLLPAVDSLCSFETYDLLRGDQGLSRTATSAALAAALTALLTTPASSGG
jgi:AcrR family transcriptional regulator